jgi:hypothetical protein
MAKNKKMLSISPVWRGVLLLVVSIGAAGVLVFTVIVPRDIEAKIYSSPLVVLVGDSITVGAGTWGSLSWGITPGATPPDFLANKLKSSTSTYWQTASAASLGWPGLTSFDWTNYVPATCSRWLSVPPEQQNVLSTYPLLGYLVMKESCLRSTSMSKSIVQAIDQRPNWAIVILGINDANTFRDPSFTVDTIKTLAGHLRSRHINTLIATPTRVSDPNTQATLDQISALMRQKKMVSKGLDLNQAYDLPTIDGAHLTVEGYDRLAGYFAEALKVAHK